jgi:hypothetical protein
VLVLEEDLVADRAPQGAIAGLAGLILEPAAAPLRAW